jgi:hypothetical protein
MPKKDEEGDNGECPICLEVLSAGTLCILPCEHEFHQKCLEELRKHGVLQACPLCRESLLAGPEKLHDQAMRMFVIVHQKVERGGASWQALTAPDQEKMAQVKAMLRPLCSSRIFQSIY